MKLSFTEKLLKVNKATADIRFHFRSGASLWWVA